MRPPNFLFQTYCQPKPATNYPVREPSAAAPAAAGRGWFPYAVTWMIQPYCGMVIVIIFIGIYFIPNMLGLPSYMDDHQYHQYTIYPLVI
jgi:hypothetical protein